MFYRYQPRDVAALMGEDVRPIIHHSVVTRMALGAEGYAPISLPDKLDVMAPYGRLILFNGKAAANQLRNTPKGKEVSLPAAPVAPRVMPPATTQELQREQEGDPAADRSARHHPCRPKPCVARGTRAGYGVVAASDLFRHARPCSRHRGLSAHQPFRAFPGRRGRRQLGPDGCPVRPRPVQAVLAGRATPWVSAVEDHGSLAAAVLISFGAMLALGQFLRRRISDRLRAAL